MKQHDIKTMQHDTKQYNMVQINAA